MSPATHSPSHSPSHLHAQSPSRNGEAPAPEVQASPVLRLALTLDEVNLILEAVGALPFARVYSLVGRIQQQAAQQLQSTEVAPAPPAAG